MVRLMDTKNSANTFSERLHEAIRHKKINQKQLAEAVGTTERTVSRWINQRTIPKHETIQKIAKACDVSWLWLEKESGPKNIEAVWGYHAKKEFRHT